MKAHLRANLVLLGLTLTICAVLYPLAVLAVEGKFFIQMDPHESDLRVSIWGMDNPQTRIAVVTFAERYLPRFVSRCWQRSS